jgi:hypothetical protein
MAKALIAFSLYTRRAKPTCPSPRPSNRAVSMIAEEARAIVDAALAIAAAPAVSAAVVKHFLKGTAFAQRTFNDRLISPLVHPVFSGALCRD